MKLIPTSLAVAATIVLASTAITRAETKTLYYPSQEEALFSIDAPSDWKVTTIDEVGDFGTLESPNGSVLQFRAQKFDSNDEAKKEVDAIMDDTAKFLEKEFKEVKLNDPSELQGELTGMQLTGKAKDKDGEESEILSATIVLGPTTVAEIWGAVTADDKDEMDAANKILGSFKPAKGGAAPAKAEKEDKED